MSLHNGTAAETERKKVQRKPLSSRDREQYVHAYRGNQGRITWTVNKASFGQNDILGCIDTISYDPSGVILDQTSTVHHIPDKKKEIVRMLRNSPKTTAVTIMVHGVDGYLIRDGKKWIPVITRHVTETWIGMNKWKRKEMPVVHQKPIKLKSVAPSQCNYITQENNKAQIVSKSKTNKKHSIKVVK